MHMAHGLRVRHARARAATCCSTRCPSPTTSCSATAWRSPRCARTAPPRWCIANNYTPVAVRRHAATATDADRAAAASTTPSTTGCSPTRCCSADTPTARAAGRDDVDAPSSATATWRSSPRRSTRSASTTTTRPRRARPTTAAPLPFDIASSTAIPTTAFGWPVVPGGLRDLLVDLARPVRRPRCRRSTITENGCCLRRRARRRTARIDDSDRIDVPRRPRAAPSHDAIAAGRRRARLLRLVAAGQLRVGRGLHQRFGLVHVDFDTQQRTPKASYPGTAT